jgi:hypothetical protein
VLAIVGGCALEASSRLLPTPDPWAQVILIIAWTTLAANRLLAWRYGRARAITGQGTLQTMAILGGAAPWVALMLLPESIKVAPIWLPADFPPLLRMAGGALVVAGVMAPFWSGARDRSMGWRGVASAASGGPLDDGCAHAVGMFLVSSNLFLGLLAAGWIALRYRSVRIARTQPVVEANLLAGRLPSF